MRQIRRWCGRLVVSVGLLGVLLSGFGVVMVWRISRTISQQAVDLTDMALTVHHNADEIVGQADLVLGNMQGRVKVLSQYADTVAANAVASKDAEPLIDRLDVELARELREARNILTSIQSGSERLNDVIKQFEALSSSMRMLTKTGEKEERESDLAALSRSLGEVSELIQQVIDFVARMEQQGITDEQGRRMKEAVNRLGEVVDRGRLRLTSLHDSLEGVAQEVVAKREQVPRWTTATAVACTLFLICFCFTQVHLIVFGRSLVVDPQLCRVEGKELPDCS